MQETHGFQLRSHGWLISFDSVVEKNPKKLGKKTVRFSTNGWAGWFPGDVLALGTADSWTKR